MLKSLTLLPLLFLLPGCNNGILTPAGKAQIMALCSVNDVLHPVVVAVSASDAAASEADMIVHPLIVAECNALGGVPVAASAVQAPIPPAP